MIGDIKSHLLVYKTFLLLVSGSDQGRHLVKTKVKPELSHYLRPVLFYVFSVITRISVFFLVYFLFRVDTFIPVSGFH